MKYKLLLLYFIINDLYLLNKKTRKIEKNKIANVKYLILNHNILM